MPKYSAGLIAEPSRLVFDLEAMLIDTVAGVQHALDVVARKQRANWRRLLTIEDLRSTRLETLITDIAGSADPKLIEKLSQDYWKMYEQESRYQAPLREGAMELVQALKEQGSELHYITTLGPEAATRLTRHHALNRMITSIYTSPAPICAYARASVFGHFVSESGHAPESFLLLSDHLPELMTAQRLGVPALGLAYGHAPQVVLETLPGVLGVASSPADVIDWLNARNLANQHVQAVATRYAARLH